MKLVCVEDYSPVDFDVEIVKQDWSAQDPIGAGNMEAAYDNCLAGVLDAIWRNTAGISIGTQYTSPNLDISRINKTGLTYYSLRSSRDKNAVPPTGEDTETIILATANHATPAYRPVLTVLYSVPITPSGIPTAEAFGAPVLAGPIISGPGGTQLKYGYSQYGFMAKYGGGTYELVESLSLVETVKKRVSGRVLFEALSLTDSVAARRYYEKLLSEALSISDSVSKMARRELSEVLSLSDAITKRARKLLTQPLSLTDTVEAYRKKYKALTESITLTDTLTRSPKKLLRETITLWDTQTKRVRRLFTEGLSLSDSVSAVKKMFLTLVESISLTETISKRSRRYFSEALSLLDTFRGAKIRLLNLTPTFDTGLSISATSDTSLDITSTITGGGLS